MRGQYNAHAVFVKNLARLLKSFDMSTGDLAKEIGLSQPAVHLWMINKGSPTMTTISKICKALGVHPVSLFATR